MKTLKNEREFEVLLKNERSLVVDFSATWCGPCKQLTPVLERYSKEHPGMTVVKVDVDEFGELADKHRIQSVPTVEAYLMGERIVRFTGSMGYDELCRKLSKLE